MVFDRTFSPPGDENNIFDTGGDALFHRVLNQRLVHNGKHFLGHSFCGG